MVCLSHTHQCFQSTATLRIWLIEPSSRSSSLARGCKNPNEGRHRDVCVVSSLGGMFASVIRPRVGPNSNWRREKNSLFTPTRLDNKGGGEFTPNLGMYVQRRINNAAALRGVSCELLFAHVRRNAVVETESTARTYSWVHIHVGEHKRSWPLV